MAARADHALAPSLMSKRSQRKASREVASLRALAARATGSSPPSRLAIRDALESGSARLLLLEADLRTVQSSDQDTDRKGVLKEEVEALRAALAELREATADGDAAMTAGIVFPDPHHRR
jgi:hypothetical protein